MVIEILYHQLISIWPNLITELLRRTEPKRAVWLVTRLARSAVNCIGGEMLPIITSGMSSVWESTGNEAAGCGRGGRGGRGLGKKTAATFTTSWERIDKSGKNKTDTGSGGDLYDDPRSDRRHILPPLFYLISSVVLVRYRQSWPSFIFLLLSFFFNSLVICWLFVGFIGRWTRIDQFSPDRWMAFQSK